MMVPQEHAAAGFGVDFGAERVLIVDDEPGIRRYLGRVISAAGREVDEFENPDEALSQLRSGD